MSDGCSVSGRSSLPPAQGRWGATASCGASSGDPCFHRRRAGGEQHRCTMTAFCTVIEEAREGTRGPGETLHPRGDGGEGDLTLCRSGQEACAGYSTAVFRFNGLVGGSVSTSMICMPHVVCSCSPPAWCGGGRIVTRNAPQFCPPRRPCAGGSEDQELDCTAELLILWFHRDEPGGDLLGVQSLFS
jgi:hypothetical protein